MFPFATGFAALRHWSWSNTHRLWRTDGVRPNIGILPLLIAHRSCFGLDCAVIDFDSILCDGTVHTVIFDGIHLHNINHSICFSTLVRGRWSRRHSIWRPNRSRQDIEHLLNFRLFGGLPGVHSFLFEHRWTWYIYLGSLHEYRSYYRRVLHVLFCLHIAL